MWHAVHRKLVLLRGKAQWEERKLPETPRSSACMVQWLGPCTCVARRINCARWYTSLALLGGCPMPPGMRSGDEITFPISSRASWIAVLKTHQAELGSVSLQKSHSCGVQCCQGCLGSASPQELPLVLQHTSPLDAPIEYWP